MLFDSVAGFAERCPAVSLKPYTVHFSAAPVVNPKYTSKTRNYSKIFFFFQ